MILFRCFPYNNIPFFISHTENFLLPLIIVITFQQYCIFSHFYFVNTNPHKQTEVLRDNNVLPLMNHDIYIIIAALRI